MLPDDLTDALLELSRTPVLLVASDYDGVIVNDQRFAIGKTVEVKFAKTEGDTLTSAFKGEIVVIEPEFGVGDLLVSFRAYDKGWRLNRDRKSRTFQDVTAPDMIKKVGSDAGLTAGTLVAGTVYELFHVRHVWALFAIPAAVSIWGLARPGGEA